MKWTFKKIIPQKARGVLKSEIWNSEEWIAEEKYDGDRRIAQFCGKVVRFTGTPSRVHGEPVERTENVPHLSGSHMVIGKGIDGYPQKHVVTPPPLSLEGTVLDGEIIVDDTPGKFGGMSKARVLDAVMGGRSKLVTSIMGSSPEEAIRKQVERGWLRYVVFDCLWYEGRDLRALPLRERRKWAAHAVEAWNNPSVSTAEQIYFDKCGFYDSILERGGEGVVLKKIDHRYGEHLKWVKVKGVWTADVVIMGFQAAKEESKKVDGRVSKTKYAEAGLIGAIVCGQYKQDPMVKYMPFTHSLVEIATVSGMNDSLRMELSTAGARGYVGLVIEIEHNGREPTGRFRHPRFKRFRPDKDPKECVINMEET